MFLPNNFFFISNYICTKSNDVTMLVMLSKTDIKKHINIAAWVCGDPLVTGSIITDLDRPK